MAAKNLKQFGMQVTKVSANKEQHPKEVTFL